MAQKFYWTHCEFLPRNSVQNLKRWGKEVEAQGQLKQAGVGKGILKKVKTSIRSDEIYWIENFSGPEGQILSNVYSELSQLVRRELFLPVKRFDCHFAKYGPGDHYTRHRDRHRLMPARLISCVLYLSTLAPQEGGELILYHPKGKTTTVQPEAGRIIIFDSSLEHEVRPCKKERWSITGWLRTDHL